MKKILTLPVIAAVFFLSGCSLSSPGGNSADQAFVFSKSIFKSSDGGQTWEAKNQGTGQANIKTAEVLSLAINPQNSQNIYAGLRKGGILKTENGGDTWNFINYQSEKVYGLTLSYPEGKTLYASGVWSGKGKMFSSDDQGQNWKELYTSPKEGPLVISLLADKKNPNILYATSSDNQTFKSSDSGFSWENIFTSDSPILKVALDASSSSLIYCITNSGSIYRSQDGGANFEKINQKLLKYGGNQFTIIETDPSVSGRVYAAGVGGLMASSDGGENWNKIYILNNPQTSPVTSLAINPQNPQEIIYGAGQAVYRSVDGGVNWITSQFEGEMVAKTLKYDPGNPAVIYAGFAK